MKFAAKALTVGIVAAALAGCSREGDLDVGAGVGVNVTRSGCPTVAVPDGTGDITIFNPASSQDADAIDIVASVTNVRTTCNESGEKIYAQAAFDVQARRRVTVSAAGTAQRCKRQPNGNFALFQHRGAGRKCRYLQACWSSHNPVRRWPATCVRTGASRELH